MLAARTAIFPNGGSGDEALRAFRVQPAPGPEAVLWQVTHRRDVRCCAACIASTCMWGCKAEQLCVKMTHYDKLRFLVPVSSMFYMACYVLLLTVNRILCLLCSRYGCHRHSGTSSH